MTTATPISDARRAQRKEGQRLRAERIRREKGVAPVKGTTILCAACAMPFVRNSIKNVRCKPCQRAHYLADANARSQKKAREKGFRLIGSPATCGRCSGAFTLTAPSQRQCEPCRALPDHKRWDAVVKNRSANGRAYRQRDPARIRALEAASRERRKVNPSFQINERMSAGVRQSLTLGKQGWRWEKLVGYTLADLMRHLERQFLPGMTWENRGEWHLDHVQPLASFRFESATDPEFRAAWALSNIRPLWALDNIAKNDRRTHLL